MLQDCRFPTYDNVACRKSGGISFEKFYENVQGCNRKVKREMVFSKRDRSAVLAIYPEKCDEMTKLEAGANLVQYLLGNLEVRKFFRITS